MLKMQNFNSNKNFPHPLGYKLYLIRLSVMMIIGTSFLLHELCFTFQRDIWSMRKGACSTNVRKVTLPLTLSVFPVMAHVPVSVTGCGSGHSGSRPPSSETKVTITVPKWLAMSNWLLLHLNSKL